MGMLSVGVYTVLKTTILPGIEVVEGEGDDDDEIELDESRYTSLQELCQGCPVVVEVGVADDDKVLVVDCDEEEEVTTL